MKHAMTKILVAFLAPAALIAQIGCVSSGRAYTAARNAERKGQLHAAYDGYCKAGREHPGDGAVAAGIKRTSQPAADYWQDQGAKAKVEGQFADAWRMFMRVLEIRPNDADAVEHIRQLEAEYPEQIAFARSRYLARGSPALAVALPLRESVALREGGDHREGEAPAEPSQALTGRVAAAEATPTSIARLPTERSAPTETRPPAPAQEKPPTAVVKPAEPARIAMATPPRHESPPAQPPRGAAEHPETQRESPPQLDQSREREEAVAPAEQSRDREGAVTAIERGPLPYGRGSERVSQTRPEAGQGPRSDLNEFIIVRTLSKKDRRYPFIARVIDGIDVKVRDTDDDREADLDVYLGTKRTKKIRGLKIGHSKTFEGRSGRTYCLTVLGVEHRSRTARIGIKPA